MKRIAPRLRIALPRFAVLVLALAVSPALAAEKSAAAKKPVPQLHSYFAADFTDMQYQQAAFNKVLKGWKVTAPLPPAGKKTVVISTIGRDGALLDTRFNLKSGSAAFDDAALAAVKAAAPFAKFPASYARPSVEVHWHFEVGN
jgi:TonB family protein